MGKVKVVGYAQRVFFSDGIEYRNFSDGLVGQQIANSDNITFTNGNFIIDTNLDDKVSRIFKTNNYSKFYTLDSINPNNNNNILSSLVSDETLKLNLNETKLRNYALFGSLREFIRTSLEIIISEWPASLYVQQYMNTPLSSFNYTGNTIENYYYDSINNFSTFSVNANQIVNLYNIDFSSEAILLNSYNNYNLRNFSINFNDYIINGEEILDYTAVTDTNFGVLNFKVNGNPFPNISGYTSENYHIKPKTELFETFFEGLSLFENYLLNRLTIPNYKSTFTYNEVLDSGVVLTKNDSFIWPVSDGYNLDFNTPEYVQYVTKLINMADKSDEVDSNMIARFLTSDSISDFDTTPDCLGGEHETSGAKMNKTLKIYGREYDEILSHIDGISHAHTVTYDKKDNIPDNIVRILGRSLGWELTSSLVNNDVLTSYLTRNNQGFRGHSRGLSISEQEIEFWRRLIINTPWIWKSKGTRKVIEMFFKFIGTPTGLYKFNEYVYTINKPLDINLFKDVLRELDIDVDLDKLNIDEDGFPKILPNTPNMYFQKAGQWYRETGGEHAVVDITTGNNPHVGPYDKGQEYLDQFNCLIPDFSSVTLHKEYVSSGITNLYMNDSGGDFNGIRFQETVISVIDSQGNDATNCINISSEIVDSPKPKPRKSVCNCDFEIDDKILKIDYKCNINEVDIPCSYLDYTVDHNGVVSFTFDTYMTTFLIGFPNLSLAEGIRCCENLGNDYHAISGYNGIDEVQCVLLRTPPSNCGAESIDIGVNGYVIFNFENNYSTINLHDFPNIETEDAVACCCGLGYDTKIINYNGENIRVCDSNSICGVNSPCELTFDLTVENCHNIIISNIIGNSSFKIYLNGAYVDETNLDYYTINNVSEDNYIVRIVDNNNCELEKQVIIDNSTC